MRIIELDGLGNDKKYNQNEQMGEFEPSFYNFYKRREKTCYVYNSRTNTLLLLNKDEYDSLLSGRVDNPEDKRMLVNGGFFVKDSKREREECIQSELNECGGDDRRMVTILPTQDCNANCFYCFNKEIARRTMSESCAMDVVRYLADNYDRKYDIHWFGGEPLCAKNIIDIISDGLTNMGIPFSSRMTTNGSCLSKSDIIKFEHEWNLRVIHLSCDGYKEEHDKRKGYTEQKNAYDQLLNNIKNILEMTEHTKVILRINLDKKNVSQLESILDDLIPFNNQDCFFIHVTHLRKENDDSYEYYYGSKEELREFYSYVIGVVKKYNPYFRNILAIKPKLKQEKCFAETVGNYVIGYDGSLFKCLQSDYSGENSVGSIYEADNTNEKEWTENSVIGRECACCKYYPLCRSGCRHRRKRCKEEKKVASCDNVRYTLTAFLDAIVETEEGGGHDCFKKTE